MQVPGFIEFGMVTALDDPRVEIEVHYVVVGRRTAEKNTFEIVFIQFTPSNTGNLNANSGTKNFQVAKFRLRLVHTFERHHLRSLMDEAVVEIDGVL